MRAAILIAATLPVWGQAPDTFLPRFLDHIRETLLAQPAYTCIQTIERTRQSPGGGQQVQDALRLEVALVDGKELFAWPGSKQFDEREITDLVTTGMIGNGSFALYSRMLFFNGAAFVSRGEGTVGGRRVAQYDFQVPRAQSGYNLRVEGKHGVAGFHGSIYADLETLDLRRLEITADDIPPELGLSASEGRVDYDRVQIGDEKFLLPVESYQMMTVDVISRNRTRFADCRKFTGESELVFIDPDLIDLEASAEKTVKEVTLPRGRFIELVLADGLDLNTQFVGDAVQARLNADIKENGRVLAPKGAIAHARVVRLDRADQLYVLGLKFTDLEWPGGHAALDLVFDHFGFFEPSLANSRVQPMYRDEFSGDIVILRQRLRRFPDTVMYWKTRP